MNIYVIMKRTFDTEEKIVIKNGKIDDSGAEFIINPYDEYAIEEAIQLRDEHGGNVSVITVGKKRLKKSFAPHLPWAQIKQSSLTVKTLKRSILSQQQHCLQHI